MPRHLGIPALALGLTFLFLAGCASAPARTGTGDAAGRDDAAPQVMMKNMAFSPASLTVHVGDTVTWTNKDSMGHSVSADDPNQWGTAGSGDDSSQWLQSGQSWSHTFAQSGTYHYYCLPHSSGMMGHRSGMTGTIIVEA